MTVTVGTFRESYPEFGDIAYPTSAVNYYISIAGLLLSSNRFGVGANTASSPPTTQYDYLTELFVAHHLTLEKRAQDASKVGGVPGEVQGPVASKSVGPLSVSYDNSAVVQLDAGHWNNSVYGIRFIQLARFFGSGPVQIGIGYGPGGPNGAWAGPYVGWPGWGA